ncbi:low specificity L-threonine aldolase [Alicyclobacillus sp. SO9]|uniref:threonine aldolase family protein n=1 Tax=Alicyclobacillus sp. SO9 TaxID=2665646 RepID=UPI0018E881B4|nr:beta-eliminating lyase-related protein [Alicyclobacillus sp. SO9]QQE80660.1 DegT/DnrJ/EryC1/StrS family aminotransferase [Alicyclobacillus sp. SO9]
MADEMTLLDAFKQTKFQVVGHGPRNVQVLKDALADTDGDLESDMYGKGKVIEDFQNKMAAYLGMEEAIFFPSGTMAQQIALRIWCDQTEIYKVAYHPLCHLEIHEQDGLKRLHNIQPVLLAEEDRIIELEDVLNVQEDISCLLLELPQREIGGQLPDYATLEAISQHCREHGIKLHLDGARLFEVLPYYGTTAEEICRLFDSVYVSLYKGIGGVAGAILAGNPDFIAESVIWKRRYGGDLISLYPYIIADDWYLSKRLDKMGQYYKDARELAEYYNRCSGISTVPSVPVSNMFHVQVELPKDEFERILLEMYENTGIGLTGSIREISDVRCYFEVSIGDQYEKVPKEALGKAFDFLGSRMLAVQ